MENVAGGQRFVDNVLGIQGLNMATGVPTNGNPNGVYWQLNGEDISENQALRLLEDQDLHNFNLQNPDEAFLANYLRQARRETMNMQKHHHFRNT